MSEAMRQTSWTWEAYLDWEARQPIRYELVDGQVHAMGGGTAEHDTIGNNLRGELHTQLRGKPCRPHGPDLKVRAGGHVVGLDPRNGRYPDALIDCGPRVPGALYAQEPVAVFEVLSKSTGWIDQSLKLRDYDATRAFAPMSSSARTSPGLWFTRVTRTDGSASRALFFSKAGMRLSRSRVRPGVAVFRPLRGPGVRFRSGRYALIGADRSLSRSADRRLVIWACYS